MLFTVVKDDFITTPTKLPIYLINTAMIANISDAPLKEVISTLGGWPVAQASWDPKTAPSLEWIVGTLKRNFTLGALIEEWVGPDDRDSNRHIIQVRNESDSVSC